MKNSRSLPERKQILIAQSAALRQEFSVTVDEIEDTVRNALGWIEHGVETGQKLKKSGTWLAVAGGLIMGWRLLRGKKAASVAAAAVKTSLLGSLIGGGFRAAGWIGTAVKLWKNWSAVQHHFRPDEAHRHESVTPRFKT